MIEFHLGLSTELQDDDTWACYLVTDNPPDVVIVGRGGTEEEAYASAGHRLGRLERLCTARRNGLQFGSLGSSSLTKALMPKSWYDRWIKKG